jgi:hypothetical protein
VSADISAQEDDLARSAAIEGRKTDNAKKIASTTAAALITTAAITTTTTAITATWACSTCMVTKTDLFFRSMLISATDSPLPYAG